MKSILFNQQEQKESRTRQYPTCSDYSTTCKVKTKQYVLKFVPTNPKSVSSELLLIASLFEIKILSLFLPLSLSPAAADLLPSLSSSTSMIYRMTLPMLHREKVGKAIKQASKHFDSMTTAAQRAAVVKILLFSSCQKAWYTHSKSYCWWK